MKRTFALTLLLSLIISCMLSACSSGKKAESTTEDPLGISLEIHAERETSSKTETAAASKAETTAAASTAGKTETTAAGKTEAKGSGKSEEKNTAAAGDSASTLWPETEMPVSLRYDRKWYYSEYEETEDPKVISGIVGAIKNIKIGEAADYIVDDYTDVLLFTFADGHTCSLEFEEDNWVTEDNKRLHADGLPALRSQLDKLLGNKVQK